MDNEHLSPCADPARCAASLQRLASPPAARVPELLMGGPVRLCLLAPGTAFCGAGAGAGEGQGRRYLPVRGEERRLATEGRPEKLGEAQGRSRGRGRASAHN